MFAYLLSVSLFLLWLLIGLGIAAALRPSKPFQNLLLAPAIGAAVTVLSVFTLNRAGLPVRSFAVPLTIALAAFGILLIWRFRPVIPCKAYAPFLAAFALAIALTGRPMFEFGFDWVSYCNDDMANYVLGAHRFADRGFFEPIDAATFFAFRDIPALFWFFHVIMEVRPGSELMLAWLIGLVGFSGFQLFMPLILALHGVLISSAAAVVYRNASRRRAALIASFMLTFSAVVALGTVYQLIGQVFGLVLVAASGALLMVRYDLISPRNLLRAGVLAALPLAAFVVVYPELLPFLGLTVAIYITVWAFRHRTAVRPLFRFALASVVALLLLLNTMIPTALNFLLRQGGTQMASGSNVEFTLFPYFLIPSGIANFFGVLPQAYYPPAYILSAAIALGIFMAVLSVLLLVPLLRRVEPAAIFSVVFLAVLVMFFYRRNDFALYKLAMYVQPFLLGCFGVAAAAAWSGKRFRRAGSAAPRCRWALAGLGAVMLAVNLFSHNYLVRISRGVGERGGGSFVEIPDASRIGITRELQRSSGKVTTPVVLTDSFNVVLTKFTSFFYRGKSFIPLTQRMQFMGNTGMFTLTEGAKLLGHHSPEVFRRAFQLVAKYEDSFRHFDFDFQTPGKRSGFLRNGMELVPDTEAGESTVLVDAASLTVINRRHTRLLGHDSVIPVAHRDLQNHLVFIPSDLGTGYYLTRNPAQVTLFQLESDYMVPGSSMSGIGRYGVFRVLNPTRGSRMVLDFSATLKSDGENKLPPAVAVGTARVHFPLLGRGSARVVSDPIEPQNAGGQRVVGFDLGVDGTPFPSPRTGLMGLYGTDVPIDRRRLVGFARGISMISEEEYQRLSPPSSVSRFPTDLLHPDLEYSGFYEDGWTAESSFVRLRSNGADHIAVRGSIPMIGTREFHTEVLLLLNGRELVRQTFGRGTFELKVPYSPQTGRNHLELRFSDTQVLPAPDSRKVSARLNFIGFEDSQTAVSAAPAQSIPDIVPAGSGISLGDKWYPIENFNGERFRWVANDAAFTVNGAAGSLNAEVEAGPGIGKPAFLLKVLDASGATVLSVPVQGRQRIQLRLPTQPGKPNLFRFHVDGGGKRIPTDPRILNFRVFRLEPPAPPPSPRDIVCCGIELGEGWHAVETFGGQTFRWVANNARFTIPASSPRRLALEVEPGPGVGSKPFTLKISDASGRQVYSVSVAGRRKVPVDLSPATYRLHLDGGGKPTPNDPRILNFRVFSIAAQ